MKKGEAGHGEAVRHEVDLNGTQGGKPTIRRHATAIAVDHRDNLVTESAAARAAILRDVALQLIAQRPQARHPLV
eukprot:4070074-Pleurochrysis_carterae.AAC.3